VTTRPTPHAPPMAVLITGVAGALGTATAVELRAQGFDIVGLDLDEQVQDQEGVDGRIVDVTDEAAVEQALDDLLADRMLHHVIQIAGGALPDEPRTQADPTALEPSIFRASIERNLTSAFVVLRATLPHLRRATGSDRSVVLTSSFNAISAQGMPAYSAAKAGLIGMMYGLVRPLGAEGIRINTVAPGTIRTPRTERIWGHDEGHFQRLEATSALGRLGSPEDVARTVRAVAVDLTHVSGQVVTVDGGQSA
jgi:NAD(P)-dependent dehydrogenase (short-subunit alcohol dehydrogenase family)